jgi:hypothetical protein
MKLKHLKRCMWLAHIASFLYALVVVVLKTIQTYNIQHTYINHNDIIPTDFFSSSAPPLSFSLPNQSIFEVVPNAHCQSTQIPLQTI